MSTLSGGSPFNLSDYVNTDLPTSQLNLLPVGRSSASAAAGSAAQLQAMQTQRDGDGDTATVEQEVIIELPSGQRKRSAEDDTEGS